MAKIMSMLEKYKLIEKESQLDSQETISPVEEPHLEEASIAFDESQAHEEDQSEEFINSDETTTSNLVQSETPSDSIASEDESFRDSYTRELSLEEIYTSYGLNSSPVNQTVFVLENLMNALPNELPEYVKKTTLDNIIIASAMNLNNLLTDGKHRSHLLVEFLDSYNTTVNGEISSLHEEIKRLSAIINEYQQQIKAKELLQQQQISSIKSEQTRLNNILEFFKD